jgi:hypothetical protein
VLGRNTADDSSDYSASSNADREMFLKTVLFARWSRPLQITLRKNAYVCIQAFEGLKLAIYVEIYCPACRNLREVICYTTGNLLYTFLLFSTKYCNNIEINKHNRSQVTIKYGPQMKYRVVHIPQIKLGHGTLKN